VNRILVKTAGRPFPCEITGSGECQYCGQPIIWAKTAKGRAIPLELFSETARFTEAHFKYCGRQLGGEASSPREYRSQPQGVEMTPEIWRRLLFLVHPDKHSSSSGDVERLANEVTRWLLEQRDRLTGEKS
jgi:hypothetical protein